ncbi:hypothetical protein EMIT0P43_10761 [Pseudomonas jessenii]
MWRGGLPPLGCAAALKPFTADHQIDRAHRFTAASPPNGAVRRSDKPPRHKKLSERPSADDVTYRAQNST